MYFRHLTWNFDHRFVLGIGTQSTTSAPSSSRHWETDFEVLLLLKIAHKYMIQIFQMYLVKKWRKLKKSHNFPFKGIFYSYFPSEYI